MKGGQVRTKVIVRLNPRVLTTLEYCVSCRSFHLRKTGSGDLRWEERVERASAEVEILHQAEQPRALVSARLPESIHHASFSF